MILRKLLVKTFAGLNPGAEIAAFGDALTVIHGPNESGKSTLFRAIEYVLYQRYGSKGAEFEKHIVPVGTKVAPEVALEFEHGGASYRVTKRWSRSPSAGLEKKMAGGFEFIAQGEAVDQKLTEILGHTHAGRGKTKNDTYGIGQILLVPQTAIVLPETLGAPALEGLRGVIRQVASGGEMLELQKKVKQRYELWFTPGGGQKSGSELGRALEDIEATKAQLAELRLRREDSEKREAQLRALERPAEEIDAERAAHEKAKTAAHDQLVRHVKLKATLEPQEATAKAAERAHELCAKELSSLEQLLRRRHEKAEALKGASERKKSTEEDADRQRAAEVLASTKLKEVEKDLAAIGSRDRAAQEARQARQLEQRRRELADKLDRFGKAEEAHAAAQKALAERARPSVADLVAIEKEIRALEDVERDLARLQLGVTIVAARELEIERNGKRERVASGATVEVRGLEPLAFTIPGVGAFTVTGPASVERDDAERRKREIENRLDAARRPFGTRDGAALRALQAERAALEKERDNALAACRAIYAKNGDHTADREELPKVTESLKDLFGRHPDWESVAPSEAHIVDLEKGITENKRLLEIHKQEFERARDDAKQALERLQKTVAKDGDALIKATTDLSGVDAELKKLEETMPSIEAGKARLLELEREAAARRAEAAARRADLDAMGDPEKAVAIAAKTAEDFEKGLIAAGKEAGRIEGELARLRGEKLHQKIAEAEEKLTDLEDARARLQEEADAVLLLHQSLAAAQSEVTSEVVRPVSERVGRMVQHVFGRRVTPTFGENYLPTEVVLREDTAVAVDQLSVGARDQLLLLTRLGFGELYARERGRHAFVLDDPLVNTDRERRARLLEVLLRATRDLQIIVFTCHPEQYFGLPDDKVKLIAVEDAKLRG